MINQYPAKNLLDGLPSPLPVIDGLKEGHTTQEELLKQILIELRVISLYLYELPRQLNQGTDPIYTDEPSYLRNDGISNEALT